MTANTALNGCIIAAPKSGSGKTLVTLALLRALKNSGVKVASAKIGPDYIDPAFHAAASGQSCLNIDPWAMRTETQQAVFNSLAKSKPDLLVIEGVMGLFDGAKDGTGSTADLAAETGLPVILVVDVKGQAASAVAVVKGFAALRDDVQLGGVIFNNVGSDAHKSLIAEAMALHLPDLPILGYLPRNPDLVMPERHLGLVQAGEHNALEEFLEKAAGWISSRCDLTKFSQISKSFRIINEAGGAAFIPAFGQHIAIAKDTAFAFSYMALIDHWQQQGGKISYFSPLADEAPSEEADAIYLPGGYPELHAAKLVANLNFLNGLRAAAAQNKFIFGECGGYMVLGESITDADGVSHKMAGLLPLKTNFQKRRLHLGYRKVELNVEGALGQKGYKFRAHEFHYATTDYVDENAQPLFSATDAVDKDLGALGLVVGNVHGSFIHLIDRVIDRASNLDGE